MPIYQSSLYDHEKLQSRTFEHRILRNHHKNEAKSDELITVKYLYPELVHGASRDECRYPLRKGEKRSQRASCFLLTNKLFSAHRQTFFCSPAEFLLLTGRIRDALRQWDSKHWHFHLAGIVAHYVFERQQTI